MKNTTGIFCKETNEIVVANIKGQSKLVLMSREVYENGLGKVMDNRKLPLVYRGRYDIFKVETNGLLWMAIRPKSEIRLVMLRKDRARVEKAAGLNCALFLDRATFYIKEKLMEEGIPFVIEGKQVYLHRVFAQ